VDHDRAPFRVGQSEVRYGNSPGGFPAGLDGDYRHVAVMALALWYEVFAGVGGVIMPSCRHASGGLAVWAAARATVRINMDIESMVARSINSTTRYALPATNHFAR
jgi:hypothetical protein